MQGIIGAAAVAVLAFAVSACSRESSLRPSGAASEEIAIRAGIGHATRVSDGADAHFEVNDAVSLYVWRGSASTVPQKWVVDGVVNTLTDVPGSGQQWVPASRMVWGSMSQLHHFLGVYPAQAVADVTNLAFTLDSGNPAASDLLLARRDGVNPREGAVSLDFDHAMARLRVYLKFNSEFGGTVPQIASVTLQAKDHATVNCLTKAVTVTGEATDIPLTEFTLDEAAQGEGWQRGYTGIQVPQEVFQVVVTTTEDGGKMYFHRRSASEGIALESGKLTTLGLRVGKDSISLESVTVANWDAVEAPAGSAMRGHEGVAMGDGLLWATCNVGAEHPWETGDYFAWGDVDPFYTQLTPEVVWKTGKEGGYAQASQRLYDASSLFTSVGGYVKYNSRDGLAILEPTDDAATQQWGGAWYTPTQAQWEWLKEHCNWVWTDNYNESDVAGFVVTSTVAGYTENSLFFPGGTGLFDGTTLKPDSPGAISHYWSSSQKTDFMNRDVVGTSVKLVHNGSYDFITIPNIMAKCAGNLVRAVQPDPAYVPEQPRADATFVDMGTDVLWATANLGAEHPWDIGEYYAWGDTITYYATLPEYISTTVTNPWTISESGVTLDDGVWREGTWYKLSGDDGGAFSNGYNYRTYPFATSSQTFQKYADGGEGVALSLEDDVAHVRQGGSVRMPTLSEMEALIAACTVERVTSVTIDGETAQVEGFLLTSNSTGNTLFFPWTGFISQKKWYARNSSGLCVYLWLSTKTMKTESYTTRRQYADYLKGCSNSGSIRPFEVNQLASKFQGIPVRAVKVKD